MGSSRISQEDRRDCFKSRTVEPLICWVFGLEGVELLSQILSQIPPTALFCPSPNTDNKSLEGEKKGRRKN